MSSSSASPHHIDPVELSRALAISHEAAELYLASDVIDLHIDSFIWTRIFGYDLNRRHGRGLFGARFYSQVDLPRIREARIGGALWSITTNPLRSARGRARAFGENIQRLEQSLVAVPDEVALVRDLAGYRAARAAGRHAAFIAIQGGNALDHGDALEVLADGKVIAVTVMHLSGSSLGRTSSPTGGGARGLTSLGRAYVEQLNAMRIFVDLAHVSRQGFFDALAVHDRAQPVVVTHTGVRAVHDVWRNLDDEQLKAVADLGGVVGVIFHGGYLNGSYLGGCSADAIVDHIEHIVNTVGDEFVSLGSDWDGLIATPRDMPTCIELPRLVQRMLERGLSPETVQRVLGGNFLRALRELRG
ncbi:MAG TPA: membrane dipeptidase [Polyangiales bacterium]|nr:membrane dipeptidase [Polyangiales bacterium]